MELAPDTRLDNARREASREEEEEEENGEGRKLSTTADK
jgi:hypothetical protein